LAEPGRKLTKDERDRRADPARVMYRQAKHRAKRDNVPFTITVDHIQIPTHCPVSGVPLVITDGRASECSPSLDRIRPELGYTPNNIIVVSNRVNTLKRDASLEELNAIAEFYCGFAGWGHPAT